MSDFGPTTVDPMQAEGNLNNLSPFDESIFLTDDQVAGMTNMDSDGYSFSAGSGMVPIDYDFSNGISSAVDGVADDTHAGFSLGGLLGVSPRNNPAGTPSSYYPGQTQGLLQSLLSFAAPKPVPQLSPSSAIVPAQTPGLMQQRLVGNVTMGQVIIAVLAGLTLVAVARA